MWGELGLQFDFKDPGTFHSGLFSLCDLSEKELLSADLTAGLYHMWRIWLGGHCRSVFRPRIAAVYTSDCIMLAGAYRLKIKANNPKALGSKGRSHELHRTAMKTLDAYLHKDSN